MLLPVFEPNPRPLGKREQMFWNSRNKTSEGRNKTMILFIYLDRSFIFSAGHVAATHSAFKVKLYIIFNGS